MTYTFKPIIQKIANGHSLDQQESRDAFHMMMEGHISEAEIGAFIMGMRVRGETIDEITGAARALSKHAHHIDVHPEAIDTCGTGGDGSHSYNISTAAAIVIAACGVKIAKHGNRSISSSCGSADVLKQLGIDIECDEKLVKKSIEDIGIGFLMAPKYHSALRHVAPVRTKLGVRTIFNLLGPLINPAHVNKQIIGVFDGCWTETLAHVCKSLGRERVWVVHGQGGLDELSISGETQVSELKDGEINSFTVHPHDAGLQTYDLEYIRGGDAHYNARAMLDIFEGEKNAYRDIVILNAAAGLLIANKVNNLKDGAMACAEALDNGDVLKTLNRWIISSQGKGS